MNTHAARASSSSPAPWSWRPALRPTPRKLNRSTAAPSAWSVDATRCTTLLCSVPPYSGCGWHTTAVIACSPEARSCSTASSAPAGPGSVVWTSRCADGAPCMSALGGAEASAQPLGQQLERRGEVETVAVSQRQQAAGIARPFLESQRRGLVEVLQVTRDAPRERL